MHVILSIDKGHTFKYGGEWYVIDNVSEVGFTAYKLRSLTETISFTNHEFGKLILSGAVFFFHDHHLGRYILEGQTNQGATVYYTTSESWLKEKHITTIQLLHSFPNEEVAKLTKADDFYGITGYNVIPYQPEKFRFKERGY